MQDKILKTKQLIEYAEAIIISAGAGMGVDSGLPDFRGDKGFWKAYPPIAKMRISFVEMANPKWFELNPDLAWAFYGHRLNLYRKTLPHSGFALLKKLVGQKKDNYFVFTSNVDGQFQKAGFDENKIYEIHGSIHHLQCAMPCSKNIWTAENTVIDLDEKKFTLKNDLPVCPYCGQIARPNILMFGDWNWLTNRADSQDRLLQDFLMKNKNKKILVFELGAGKAIPSVRNFSESLVYHYQANLIRINPRDFEVPNGEISFTGGAQETLEKIIA